jgi:CheY-like chemotaxis protein
MQKEIKILIAEDDEGHATLIKKNLNRAGIVNEITHFKDGQEILDFITPKSGGGLQKGVSYLILLDIRMPKLDVIEVLRQIKSDEDLKKIPVIMITTTDDPDEVEKCHQLGCNNYITKPIDYVKFVDVIRQLGLFLSIVEVPVSN